jgi:hypothetical protein
MDDFSKVNSLLNQIAADLADQKANAYIDSVIEDEIEYLEHTMGTYSVYSWD